MNAFIECIDFGCFPGYASFCYMFKYDEIVKFYKGSEDKGWSLAISEPDDNKLIDGSTYLAMSRTICEEGELDKKYYYIIINEEFNFTDYEYCKLAHEALHICQFYLPTVLDRNIEIEAEAYLHTHIMTQCLDLLRNKNIKK